MLLEVGAQPLRRTRGNECGTERNRESTVRPSTRSISSPRRIDVVSRVDGARRVTIKRLSRNCAESGAGIPPPAMREIPAPLYDE